ncbi:MAG: phosphopyruvate hydratase [Crenarchaeota archaeon 13_1_20CM_2_51_8]|nr:MAG: phosphopyruvate hydratase [Crenarchaeota archaeon 13_1_20CM_2_51_8]
MTRSEFRIEKILSREVLDSRANPTVQVDLYTASGFGRFSVPSGKSKGRLEAIELRDGDKQRYTGLGVQKAVENVNSILGPKILGMDSREQEKIDEILINLDGTDNKARLGANAILGVSIALARASADTAKSPLYRALAGGRKPILPLPLMNILNGGQHAGNDLSFQEFMVMPAGFRTLKEALRCGAEVYHALRVRLEAKYGKSATNVGDEGGFAPPISSVEEALGQINDAVEEAGYSPGQNVILGIDAAADSFYNDKDRTYAVDGREIDPDELLELYISLQEKFPLKSIEDPFHDEDFENFSRITKKLGAKLQIVGDDLFVTNIKRVAQGIGAKAANALLVKINQIGTLTETIEAVEMARKADYGLVLSHRSGETEDNSIADISVGLATGQIKAGAPARGERTSKYNRLLLIEEELGSSARFYGPEFLKSHN